MQFSRRGPRSAPHQWDHDAPRQEQSVQHTANIGCLVAATIALLSSSANAEAEDQLKIVIDQRGPWNLAAPELGQQAGIFTKHGIILDLKYSEADKEAVVAHN